MATSNFILFASLVLAVIFIAAAILGLIVGLTVSQRSSRRRADWTGQRDSGSWWFLLGDSALPGSSPTDGDQPSPGPSHHHHSPGFDAGSHHSSHHTGSGDFGGGGGCHGGHH